MKKLLMAGLLVAAASGWAQSSTGQTISDKAKALTDKAKAAAIAVTLCDTCGTVQTVKQEKRKGKGGMLGMAGGAVAGGLLGNQVGKGTGNTVATVGGAVAGGVIGNEIQKKVTSKKVWVSTVKMKDGTVKTFEQEAQPAWAAGNTVKVDGTLLTKQ
jgi:outer membrane lipoprotein SlyB